MISCSGLPFYLIKLAKELHRFPFHEIEVVKNKNDNLRGTPGHSKTKKKQDKVIIRHKGAKQHSYDAMSQATSLNNSSRRNTE